jgi:hypothetical protein
MGRKGGREKEKTQRETDHEGGRIEVRGGGREGGREVPGDFEGVDVVSGVVVSHTRGAAVHVCTT